MTPDREQIRRDAGKSPYGQMKELVAVLEAELEQVKRDRDEWRASERRVLAELEQAERIAQENIDAYLVEVERASSAEVRAEQAERERDELKARQGRDALNGPAPSDRRSPFGNSRVDG